MWRTCATCGGPPGLGKTSLARASLGTPRLALALVSELSDLALAHVRHHLDIGDAWAALKLAGLDERGLGSRQQRALKHLKSRRRPVGTRNLAALLGSH